MGDGKARRRCALAFSCWRNELARILRGARCLGGVRLTEQRDRCLGMHCLGEHSPRCEMEVRRWGADVDRVRVLGLGSMVLVEQLQ